MERRLAAIFVANMVGYSRLMEADEEGTLANLGPQSLKNITEPVTVWRVDMGDTEHAGLETRRKTSMIKHGNLPSTYCSAPSRTLIGYFSSYQKFQKEAVCKNILLF